MTDRYYEPGRSIDGRTSRRGWLSAMAALGAAGSLLTRTGAAAPAGYGILGNKAPVIEAEHWIDANGKPTEFDMTETHGRWVLVKCFQSW